jgi:hypothetical protein
VSGDSKGPVRLIGLFSRPGHWLMKQHIFSGGVIFPVIFQGGRA